MEVLEEKQPILAAGRPAAHPPAAVAASGSSFFNLSWQAARFEEARFGWMSILMTAQSCVGAIACMFILLNNAHVVWLALCAAVTMGSNAMFIGLASARACLITFYLSAIVNTVFIILNQ